MIHRLSRWLTFLAFGLAIACHGQVNCFTGTSCVTLTGSLTGSNGATASNYTLSFTPTQTFYIAGTGVVINTTTNCATDMNGAVVGLSNPNSLTTITPAFSGALPAGNYYVEYSFYQTVGMTTYETLPSVEQQVQLSATGALIIQAPAGGIPSLATGMRVYIGSASGSETLQGSTVNTASYVQNVALVSGASPLTTNTSICKQVANDAGWPTGTGYNVALTDSSGNTVPNYPMQWQLLGPNTTINLSNGLPYYHGTVIYPSPILATPQNHAQQSISGNLSLSGYALVNAVVNAIGGNSNFQILNGVYNAALYPAPKITNAVAAASASGGTVWIPCGSYSDNVDIIQQVSILGENTSCVQVTPLNPSLPLFSIDASNVSALERVSLANMTLICPASTTCADAILIQGNGTNQINDNHLIKNILTLYAGGGTSSTFGFNNGLDITGRTINTTVEDFDTAFNRNDGLSVTGTAGPVNNLFVRDSSFNNNWNYGIYWNQTGIGTASTAITFQNDTVQDGGINTALTDCAGVYLNQVGGITFRNGYFEDNCASNGTTAKIAQIRATGNVVQSMNVRENLFNSPNNEWSIYDDASQTSGEWDGNTAITAGRGFYLSTASATSAVHIGENFGEVPPTIVMDGNGWTHAMSSYPLGVDITEYNQTTIGGITAALSSDIWLENSGSETITVIPGGHSGQLLILRQVGASGTTLTYNSGGAGSLELLNGGNRMLAAGQSALFINDGTNWQEISPGPSSSTTIQYLNAAMGGTCPSAASVGAACTSGTLSFPSSFVDSAYAVTCTVYNQTGFPTVSSVAITGNQTITVTIAALTALGVNGNVHCIATR